MNNKAIKKLNKQLGLSLGLVSDQPRYAWKRTSELFYLMKDGTKNTDNGRLIILVEPRYFRHSWADKIGRDCWILAKWDFPRDTAAEPKKSPTSGMWERPIITPQEWAYGVGLEFPYPHKGQYYAIENAQLDPDQEPDADDTQMVIARVRAQETQDPTELIAMLRRAAEKPAADKKAEFGDEVDDMWPAFNNTKVLHDRLGQSRGGHISFGGI